MKFIYVMIFVTISVNLVAQNIVQNSDIESGTCNGLELLYWNSLPSSSSVHPFWGTPNTDGTNANKYARGGVNCNSTPKSMWIALEYKYKKRHPWHDKTRNPYAINLLSQQLKVNHRYKYSFDYTFNSGGLNRSKIGFMFTTGYPSQTKVKKGSRLYDYGASMSVFPASNGSSGEFDVSQSGFKYLIVGHFEDKLIGNDELVVLTFDNIVIEDLGLITDIDCVPNRLIQNTIYTSSRLFDAQNSIRSGYNVGGAGGAGNVSVNAHQFIVYKAGAEVTLEPGFETKPEANFLAYIDVCDADPCYDASVLTSSQDTTIEICGDSPTIIDSYFPAEITSSIKWDPQTYLSSPRSNTTVFNPPSGSNGVQKYTVTYTNACGISITKKVTVVYGTNSSAATISLSNMVNQEYQFNFSLATDITSEYIDIEIVDLNTMNTIYMTGKLTPGVDYTAGSNFPFSAPLHATTSVCGDYDIIVKTKNTCNLTIASQTINWNRNSFCSPKPQMTTPASFSPDGDGVDDEYCIQLCGVDFYDIQVTDGGGLVVFSETNKAVTSNNMCVWDGGVQVPDNYFIEITLHSCGNTFIQPSFTVALFR